MQESNRNHLRDFVDIAGPLGVSHFLILTATENAAYLRLAKTPRVSTWVPFAHLYLQRAWHSDKQQFAECMP